MERSRFEATHCTALEFQSYKYSGPNVFGKKPWILTILDLYLHIWISEPSEIFFFHIKVVKNMRNLEPLFKCRQAREIEIGLTVRSSFKNLATHVVLTWTWHLLAHWITRTACNYSWVKRKNFFADQKQNITVWLWFFNRLLLLYCLDITTDWWKIL